MSEQTPDQSVPSPERQQELTAAHQKNTGKRRRQRPPYADVAFHNAGELAWVISERQWQPGAEFGSSQCIDLREADLSKANLAGMDLRGCALSDARIDETDFSKADLRGARISNSIITGDFSRVLRRSHLRALLGAVIRGFVYGLYLSGVLVGLIAAFVAGFAGSQFSLVSITSVPTARLIGAVILVSSLVVSTISVVGQVERTSRKSSALGPGPIFRETDLRGADLRDAFLRDATFYETQLKGTNFTGAYLQAANFTHTALSGANFSGANLTDCRIDSVGQMVTAIIDSRTTLKNVIWGTASMQYQEPPIGRGTRFELRVEPVLLLYYLFLVAGLLVGGLFFVTNEVPEGIPAIPIDDSLLNVIWIWGGASAILLYLQMILSFRLSDSVRRASQDRKSRGKGRREEGAEKGAKESPSFYLPGKSERRTKRAAIATYLRDRARVYRATALGLRQSGLYEQAAAYRLEELTDERKADYLDALYGRWIVSSLLNLVAGYGERPARILITYLITILSFAAIYLGLNIGHISFGEALVLSLTSFHGRGFFNPSGMLSDTVAGIAAAEAVIGLLIEIVLIATLTRRFIPGS